MTPPSSPATGAVPSRIPAHRRLRYALLGASVVLAPLALTAWFATCPTFDAGCPDQTHTVAVLADFRALSPSLMHLFLWANVAAPYLYPVSYLALGLLAMRRAPWLATLGIILGWAGSIPWGLVADQMFMLHALSAVGHDTVAVAAGHQYYTTSQVGVFLAGWGGHLAAYVLLGLALWRARAVPRWSAALIIAGVPLMMSAYFPGSSYLLQVAGYALEAIGAIPAAAALIRGGSEPALAPALDQPKPVAMPRNP
jgi:hypothetical protein